MEIKEQIKRNVSITDVVSMYVDLKPAGKDMKALCPFHTEKTPSFFVMPEKDRFSCYGCNKFGDIFTFIQEIENLSFRDAMNYLVDKFNIPIDRKSGGSFVKKDLYAKINQIALRYFRSNLLDNPEGKKAADYLEQREIRPNIVEKFSLGYALNRWDGLLNHLKRESVDIEKAIELGLLIKNESQRIYDRFRGRVIFPIFSESGAPIAFGGRTIFDEPNKYLNSPDTPLYKKSKNLYGFNLSKNAIRDAKTAVLVEGYFDVVSLFQQGIENVSASLGTALTENQIYLLKRFSDKIYIFYDSDRAGINAAVRGIEKMFEQNINPGIITLSGDDANGVKDPDDFVRAHGLKGFTRLKENATDGFQFLVDKITQKYDLQHPEQKNDAIRSIMSFVEKFREPIVQGGYRRMVADYFKVDEQLLKLKKQGNRITSRPGGPGKMLNITLAERIFLESLLTMPPLIDEIRELMSEEILSILNCGNIIRSLVRCYNSKTGDIDNFRDVTEELNEAEQALFRNIYEAPETVKEDRDILEERVDSAFQEFQDMVNRRNARRIDQEIKIAEQQNDIETLQRLLNKKNKYFRLKYVQKQKIGGTVDKYQN
ncbi:MAG: DNA primase [bacterium]|nr:DNA primase [bacterium]